MKFQGFLLLSKLPTTFKLILFIIIIYCTLIYASDEVKLLVEPDQAVAGTYQDIKITFIPGSSQIRKGGGIRFEIPVSYLETAPYFWDPPQNDVPETRGYVHAYSSNSSKIDIKIYGHRKRIFECYIKEDSLDSDEKIFVEYSGIVQSLTWKCYIRTQWRESETHEWKDIKPYPEINILPQPAKVMLVAVPSDAQINENIDVSVVFLDKFGNRATDYTGSITLKSTDFSASIPSSYIFTEQDSGIHIFRNVGYGETGFHRIIVSDGNVTGNSNYTWVSKNPPEYRRYFGDTHFHTGTGTGCKGFTDIGAGGDHRGHFTTEFDAYKYARDVMRLDFASAAEHDVKLLDESIWSNIQDICDSFYEPNKFTTFYAYEWTADARVGHHVVIYKNRVTKPSDHFNYSTNIDLWNALDNKNEKAIVIPHPMWTQTDHEIWKDVNNKHRRIGEIYSLWCNRFLLQPADDLQRFELGADDPWSFQYAWKNGHKIGVIGSSDNHTARPGSNNFTTDVVHSSGLAAVIAKQNDRTGLWDAFQGRRTYATTGTRIYLDFTCDDHFMGEEFSTDSPPLFFIRVGGTNKIESVELVKYDSKGFRVIYKETPDSDTAVIQFRDLDFSENSLYYLRVKQVDEIWRGVWAYPTAEMAWSSPIWINYLK
ncbi:DUF3604 domain-containing protein [Bacteroidota bacterium]